MDRSWFGLLAILIALLMLSGCARQSDPEAQAILKDMVQAGSHHTYAGTKTMEQHLGGKVLRLRMKVSHQAPDRTRLEIFEPAEERGTVLVKRGGEFWRIGKDKKECVHFPRFGSLRAFEVRNIGLLLENYRLERAGTATVAGRLTDVLKIVSRSQPGTHRSLWVDRASRLPLRSEEVIEGPHGKSLRRLAFERIRFVKGFSQASFSVPMQQGSRSVLSPVHRKTVRLLDVGGLAPFAVHVPKEIPRGFALETAEWVEQPEKQFLHLRYSDGLRAISLFQESSSTSNCPCVLAKDAASGSVIRMQEGPFTILHRDMGSTCSTLFGEVSDQDLIRMISSLEST